KFQSNASTMGAVIRDYPNGEFNMCGIVGAVGKRDITPILLEGLKRLEYRGYDSCGVAVHADGELKRARSTQRVAELVEQVAKEELAGFTGIAHTRYGFESQTDTEVIAYLEVHLYDGDDFLALQAAVKRLQVAYAMAVFCRDEPHRVVGARQGSPLVVGLGVGENFLASDALALA